MKNEKVVTEVKTVIAGKKITIRSYEGKLAPIEIVEKLIADGKKFPILK